MLHNCRGFWFYNTGARKLESCLRAITYTVSMQDLCVGRGCKQIWIVLTVINRTLLTKYCHAKLEAAKPTSTNHTWAAHGRLGMPTSQIRVNWLLLKSHWFLLWCVYFYSEQLLVAHIMLPSSMLSSTLMPEYNTSLLHWKSEQVSHGFVQRQYWCWHERSYIHSGQILLSMPCTSTHKDCGCGLSMENGNL